MIGNYPSVESIWAVALAMLVIVMAYGISIEQAGVSRKKARRRYAECRSEGGRRMGRERNS